MAGEAPSTHGTSAASAAPAPHDSGVADRDTGGAAAPRQHDPGHPGSSTRPESGGARFLRKARRGRLFLNAFGAAALLVYVVALAVSNTHRVKVDWVFGSSSVSLVWLVLLAAVLGWLLGLLVATVLRRRTRAPRVS